jgi:hypothetical protein
MFFSCSSNSWSHYSLTSFCRKSLSYCFLTRFVAKSMKIRKKCLISNVHFFFEILIIFHFEKAIFEFVIEIVNDVVDELMTNRNTFKTICDSLMKYNRIQIYRTCFVFCFFFRRILHYDDPAMCSQFSHVLHILYFSVIDESHSLMWCLMTHFSYTTTIRQCFFMCSYFWQLKHCRKM